MTPDYFARVSPTYIENWGDELFDLSIRQVGISLSSQEANILGRQIGKYRTWFKVTEDSSASIDRILNEIKEAIGVFPEGVFIRLGSRSAKDSSFAQYRGLRVTRAEDAIKMLTDSSKRIAFDLRMAIQNNYNPHIFVREWVDIPSWAEFRCFMKNRQLIGISQYDCKNLGYCPEIVANAGKIKTSIYQFFKRFEAVVHLDDVVFDVFITEDNSAINVKLLELNPFFVKTDACLFNWDDEDDFDGSFRFFCSQKEVCKF